MGAGRVVLFHVTANADWSNLPLSGLFVDMLRRLVALSVGVAGAEGTASLAPVETLDGFGLLSHAAAAAVGLAAERFASTPVSPRHPPGLYGPENGRQALNLGASLPALQPAPVVSGAKVEPLVTRASERALGALAAWRPRVVLLALDLLLSLGLRGLLRRRVSAGSPLAALVAAGARRAAAHWRPTRTRRLTRGWAIS